MKTVLITGCSSGFGLETARYFHDKGWKIIATMRTPREDILPRSDRMRVIALDVASAESIRQALDAAGPIDVLVNNAGIGMLGALEGTPVETARDIFETNTLGTIAMTQAVIPQFRERRAGVIVNVTSTITLKALPLASVYTASKAAVNAFTESVALELATLNIRARIVLPGRAPGTSFGQNAQARMKEAIPEAYAELGKQMFASVQDMDAPMTESRDVAEAVWRAATDEAAQMRIPAGKDAVALAREVGGDTP